MKHFALTLLMLFLLASPSQSQIAPRSEKADHVVIPLIYDTLANPMPLVMVRINSSKPMPFILDTGYSEQTPLLFEETAKTLRLKKGETVASPYAGSEDGYTVNITQMQVACAEKEQWVDVPTAKAWVVHWVDFFKPSFTEPVAGVIGASFLKNTVAQFDFAAHTLTLFSPDRTPSVNASATRLKMLPTGRTNRIYAVSLPLPDGLLQPLVIDTGAEALYLSAPVIAQLRPSKISSQSSQFRTVQGSVANRRYLLPSFPLTTPAEPNVSVLSASDSPRNLLGMEFLARFQVTLDFVRQEMSLVRASDYTNHLRIKARSTVAVADNRRIKAVLAGSEAKKAGMENGDLVLSVDGIDCAKTPPVPLQKLLDGYEGTQALVMVQHRDGQTQTLHYQRESGYVELAKAGIGVGVGKDASGHYHIETVDDNSPAQEAGIQVGDELIRVNSKLLSDLTGSQLRDEVKQPEGAIVTLTIQRRGEDKPREFRLTVRKLMP